MATVVAKIGTSSITDERGDVDVAAVEKLCAEVAAARGLSPREAEVLVFLARGFTPAYIAKSLVLSISTVRTHVRNIYRKLNVNKREELIHLIDEG